MGTPSRIPVAAGSTTTRPPPGRRPARQATETGRRQEHERARATIGELAAAPRAVTENLR
ncbi:MULTISPECIES: hypothetical protein [Protofrankia]|uniref:hypothetical protein n=1 Tax=Protofrankia TaxID=2994361 RepID=UPI001041458E|nr:MULTISPECIES: hypothetical protein [Protofrankia]